MTVAEFIEWLQQQPQNATVHVLADLYNGKVSIGKSCFVIQDNALFIGVE